jgi:hypothetical protein
VALFSHFTLTEAVYAHIQEKGGALNHANLLSGPASQFVGSDPDPNRLAQTSECHDRGTILVAAVFDAFLTIYKSRTDDFFRIAA